jgi:hypothetical protein
MATRARIGIELTQYEATSIGAKARHEDYWDTLEGTVLSSYQHWDGYPAALGYTLLKHYSDRDKLLEAIELGDASVWGKDIHPNKDEEHTFSNPQPNVNVYYGRDRSDKDSKPETFIDVGQFGDRFNGMGEEYGYVLRLDNTWSIFDRTQSAPIFEGLEAVEHIIRERIKLEERIEQIKKAHKERTHA